MSLAARMAFGGLVVGTALAYYVQRRHVTTGDSYVRILKGLPAAARRSADDVKRRATKALEEGKVAARARDEELVRHIEAAETGTSFATYPSM